MPRTIGKNFYHLIIKQQESQGGSDFGYLALMLLYLLAIFTNFNINNNYSDAVVGW